MVALFVWNRLRYDLVALLGLLTATASGVVPPGKAFAGFGDQVVVIVASALVLSAAVGKSGVIGRAVRRLEPGLRTTGARVATLTAGVTVLSAFMKNIGALAIFLPIAVQVARRSGTSASMLLMPMAFGSLVGGLVTLVGTSPNILVSRVRAELTGQPFAMFDFTPVGLGVAGAALAFLAFGWQLLPGGRRPQAPTSAAFEVEPYLSEARLPGSSWLVGKTVAELEARGEGEVAVIAIVREGDHRYVPAGHWTLFADDLLVLRSDPHALRKIIAETGLRLAGVGNGPAKDLPAGGIGVVEAVVMPNSVLIGCSPEELRLREVHGVNLLAIARGGQGSRRGCANQVPGRRRAGVAGRRGGIAGRAQGARLPAAGRPRHGPGRAAAGRPAVADSRSRHGGGRARARPGGGRVLRCRRPGRAVGHPHVAGGLRRH